MNSSVLVNSGGFVADSLRKLRGNRPGVVVALFTLLLFVAGCGGSSKTATPTPTFTPGVGSYTSAQNVTVSDTNQNAVLYCTNDGSAPTASSPQCANPIKVAQSQTLNAIAIAPGMASGAVATAAYTIAGSAVAPTVTGIGPAAGSSAGGTSVTIVGTNFTGVTAVNFGTTQAASFTVNSATSITAVSPAGSGSVHITVVAAGGTSATTTADVFSYGAVPSITGLSPASAIVSSAGFTLTVSGDNFTSDAVVQWNGATLTTTFVSSTQLTVTVPASLLAAAGTATVTVKESGGASTGMAFLINAAAPSIVAISPAQGPIMGGTAVNITGANFTGVSAVKFGAASAASFQVNSATSITAVSPAGSAGTVDIQVITASGATAAGSSDQLTYLAPPAVTSISPTTGSTAGGTTVAISGINLANATAVNFGTSAAASFLVNSSTSITAVSPAGSAGTVDIRVVTPGGASAASGADQYIYAVPVPTVTGLSVAAGSLGGGTTVTITGTNFITGGTAVNFGNTPATSVQVNSATSITAVAPPESAGTVPVTVTTQYGTSAVGSADQFTFTSAPIVKSVSPSAGPLVGEITVTIQGENLSGATAVKFGGTPGSNISASADGSTISVTSPAGSAGTVDVAVVTAGGNSATGSAADQFTYVPAPTVTGISPTTGSTDSETPVTIRGTNFSGTGYTATAVNFGSTVVTLTSGSVNADGTIITATSPGGSAGAVDVIVVTPGGSSSAIQFTYAPPPVVESITPSVGPVTGGTSVTIGGSGFTNATEVDFGSTAVTTGLSVSTDGKSITVTTPAAGSVGAVDVKVVTPIGASTLTGGFTYDLTISGMVGSGPSTPSTAFTAIKRATVQLYAAGTTGYGTGTSGPTPIETVTADDNGNFSFLYSCPQTLGGDQMYLVATGPESGSSPVVLMAALGTCGGLNAATTVTINEATTIASAFSLAQFASIATHGIDIGAPADTTTGTKCDAQDNWQSTGPKTCNYIGLKNAFATVQNLVDIPTGAALNMTPYYKSNPGAGVGYNSSQVPQARINALANALASCANPSSTTCTDLFTATKVGSTEPVDTLQAALDIAQNPGANVSAIYDQTAIITPFTSSLTAAPSDWALALVYQGAGLSNGAATGVSLMPIGLAIDGQGNLWIPDTTQLSSGTGGLVAVFNNLGVPLSPSSTSSSEGGYKKDSSGNNAIINPQSIAIDQNGYAWIGNYTSAAGGTAGSVTVLDAHGNVKFGSPYSNQLLFLPSQAGMAVDANNNVWVSSNIGGECNGGGGPSYGGSILQLSAAEGSVTATNLTADYVSSDNSSCPTFLTIDQSGNMWTYDAGNYGGNDEPFAAALDLFSTTDITGNLANLAGGPYWNDGPVLPPNMAMDSSANAWFSANFSILQQSAPGTNTTPAGLARMDNLAHYTTGDNSSSVGTDPTVFVPTALSTSFFPFPSTVSIDGNSNAWVVGVSGSGTTGLYEANNNAATLSPAAGFLGYDNNGLNPIGGQVFSIPFDTAIDSSGNVWVVSPGRLSLGGGSGSTLAEFVGITAPVPTPLAAGLVGNGLGAKP